MRLDPVLVPAGREDGGLIEQVLQVRPAEAGRAAGHLLQIHIVGEGFVAGVNLEDLQPILQGGQLDGDATVEAAGPQQSGIQNIRAIGRRHHDHVLVGLETVQLGEQLVQGVLPLVLAPGDAHAPLVPYGVELVDEDDGRSHLLRIRKQTAHPRGAHADKQFDEIGARDAHERHIRLSRHGPRQQGLAGPRRPYQENTLGGLPAQPLNAGRIAEVLDDLLQLDLGAVGPGHVLKRRPFLPAFIQMGPTAHKREDPLRASQSSPPQQKGAEADEDEKRQHARQNLSPPGHVLSGPRDDIHLLRLQQRKEIVVSEGRYVGEELPVRNSLAGRGLVLGGRLELSGDLLALHDDLLHVAGFQMTAEGTVADRGAFGAEQVGDPRPQEDEEDEKPENQRPVRRGALGILSRTRPALVRIASSIHDFSLPQGRSCYRLLLQ